MTSGPVRRRRVVIDRIVVHGVRADDHALAGLHRQIADAVGAPHALREETATELIAATVARRIGTEQRGPT